MRNQWTRQQLLVAFELYCRLPYGQLDHRTPEVIQYAEAIGRTPSALAMKMSNIASLDPTITSTGRAGLGNASAADRAMWEEMNSDWEEFAVESQQALEGLGLVEPAEVVVEDDTTREVQRAGLDHPFKLPPESVKTSLGQQY